MKLANHQFVLVTGAGGFIGKHLVARLLKHGWPVKAMVRKTGTTVFPPHERLQVVFADMRDADSLRSAMGSVAVVVHLAAAKSDEKDSEDVNVGGARRLVAACQAEGCGRLINISTMAVKIPRKGTYARTKDEADRLFQSSGLEVTTLLPNVVYGGDTGGVFGTVLRFIQKLPVVPVLGDGQWICAPICVGDVSKAIISCIETDMTRGRTYDLAGPDRMTFDEFIDRLGAAVNVRRPKMHIPFAVALAVAQMAARLLSHPPITVSNVLGSNQNVPIDNEPARRDFGFNPLDFDTGLNATMGTIPNPRALKPESVKVAPAAEVDAECSLISRYLLGVDPPQEFKDRYRAGQQALFGEESLEPAEPEVKFLRAHPWALPYLDAGAVLLNRESILRKKIILMTAILEASPTYAEFFLHAPETPLKAWCGLVWQSVRSIVKMIIAVPVFLVARRSR